MAIPKDYFSFNLSDSLEKLDQEIEASDFLLYQPVIRANLEIYLGARMIKGLPVGVYHYNVKGHFLEKIGNKEILGKLRNKINPSWAKEAALILVITAVFHRTLNKYQDRGYRYILLDAGHLAQNLYLLAAALDLKCCELGDFLENQLNNVLDIDDEIEGTIYVLVFGN